MASRLGVAEEVFGNRETKEQGHAGDEKVAHWVHVSELQKREAYGRWNGQMQQKF